MKRLLVVEDDASLRETLDTALAGEFEMAFAASAEEALGQISLREPDLVLVDERLPGLSGTQLIARVRGFSRSPVVLFSAHADTALARRAFRAGVQDMLAKPFDIQALRSRLAAATERVGVAPPGVPFALRAARRIEAALHDDGRSLEESVLDLQQHLVEDALDQNCDDDAGAGRQLGLPQGELRRLRGSR